MAKGTISSRIAKMKGYAAGEQTLGRPFIKLNTNENPYPPSPLVARAVSTAAAEGLERYPPPLADELRKKAAEVYGSSEGSVLVGNGSDELLAICLRACAGEGDRVAYSVPTYSLYRTLAEAAGAEIVETEVGAEARARASVTFICNPNSPSGRPVALDHIASVAAAAEGLVVSDEAYVDFGGESALPLVNEYPNLVVTRSFSKSFSLAGVRLGLVFGRPELVEELIKVKDSYNVSRFAIAAGIAALDDMEWMAANTAKVVRTRERVIGLLRRSGWKVGDSAANFFWLDCAEEGGRGVYERLRAEGVLVRFFDVPRLAGGVRITVGDDEQMDRLVALLNP